MKLSSRSLAVAVLLCLAGLPSHAQNTTVTASALKMKGVPIASGIVTFTPVDISSHAIPFLSAGLNSPQAFACRITSGALSGCSVPDVCQATPANLKYQVTISSSGFSYTFAQPVPNVCGATWALDTYAPPGQTSNWTPVQTGYGADPAPNPCPNGTLYVSTTGGGKLYICVGGVPVLVTGGGGGSITFPSGLLFGAGSTSAPTAANSSQVQNAIGSGVYDAAGAAAAAEAAAIAASDPVGSAATAQSAAVATAEAFSADASNLTLGTLDHARLPALLSADIPNNAASTSGTAAGLSANIAESQVTGLVSDLAAAIASSLQKASNLSDLADAATARTNLGLGSAATRSAPVGTIVGTTDTQTLTNKTLDGVAPATMAFVDPTSSIQTQLNSKGTGTVTSGTAPIVVSGAAASCPTCAIQGDTTLVGGILGGYHGSATNSATVFPFGITGGGWVAQTFTAWYRDLAIVTSTAQAAGEWHTFSFAQQAIGGASTGLPQFAVAGDIQSSAAAGVYSSNISNFAFPIPARTAGAVKILGANASTVFRGYSWDLIGSTSQPLGWAAVSGISPSGTSTSYVSPSQATGVVATEALQAVVIPYTSTAKNLCVSIGSAQPASGTLVFTLRRNGTTNTSLTATVAASGATGLYCDTTDTAAVTAGDWVTISAVNNATTAPDIRSASFELVPSGSATGMIVFPTRGLTFASGSAQYAAPFAAPALQTTEALQRAPMPRAVSMKNLSCVYTTPPGTSPIVATVMQNGSATALTVSIPTTGSGTQTQTDSTHTVSFSALNTFDLQFSQASGTSPIISSCSVEVD